MVRLVSHPHGLHPQELQPQLRWLRGKGRGAGKFLKVPGLQVALPQRTALSGEEGKLVLTSVKKLGVSYMEHP